jgi:AraC family transcriptional regulator
MTSTSADHVKRINRTLTYIDDHLGDQLDLSALASIACFSKFHFHRVFKQVAGMSPQEYVKRRRLEMAYHFLSNFARSFKARYSFPPRNLKSPSAYPFRAGSAGEGAKPFVFIDPSLVRLETIEPLRILFVRRKGSPTDPAVVEPVFLGLRAEADRRGWTMPNARVVVIGKSIPGLVAPEDSVFDLGIEIPASAAVDDLDVVQTIPGGTHAKYEYRGDPSKIADCWAELYLVWLKRSGLAVGSGFGFTVVAVEPEGPYSLFLPIRSKNRR